MTNFSGEPLSPKTGNAACGGPQGGGMDSRRTNQVAEVNSKYLVEAVKNAVPTGYKQTEVGVIPEDWDVATIEELAGIIDPQPDHRTPPESSNGEPYIGISDFINSKEVDWTASRKIISKAVDKQEKSFQLQKGDIVFGKIGTIGVPKFVPQVPFRFALSANVILLQPKNVEPVYLMEFFYSELFQKALKSELHSTSQAAFGMNKMRLIELPLPPKKEQTAISNALSDVDALISELEKLIAKKQAIKTATMQQLLTGRTRLPQFAMREDGTPKGTKPSELGEIPDDWEILGLGALFQPSVSKKPIKPKSLVSFVGMQDVTEQAQLSTQHLLAIENVKSGFTYFERGDVLVAKITPCFENGKGCHTETLRTDIGFGSTEFHVLRATDNSDSRFIYYWSNRNVFRKSLESEMVGSAGHRRVPLSAIAKYTIPVPPKEEQTAIATILSDMDDEIQALEQRLGKTRHIKQGMMQELLTGKTRLVKPKEQ